MQPVKSAYLPSLRMETGVSLPVVLMFLLVITILGTLGIRRATTGETLSRNQLDYEVARQAAEAALRDGERDLRIPSVLQTNALCARGTDRPVMVNEAYFGTNCPRGQCGFALDYYDTSNYMASPVVNPEPWWPTINDKQGRWDGDPAGAASPKPGDATGVNVNCDFNGSVPLGTFTGVARLAGVARQPEYLIEYVGRTEDQLMRITSRGFGADINTEVVMQSYYRPYK